MVMDLLVSSVDFDGSFYLWLEGVREVYGEFEI